MAGLLVSWAEGVEVNVARLVFDVNPKRLALKFPPAGAFQRPLILPDTIAENRSSVFLPCGRRRRTV